MSAGNVVERRDWMAAHSFEEAFEQHHAALAEFMRANTEPPSKTRTRDAKTRTRMANS
jgi:hypothetical protein